MIFVTNFICLSPSYYSLHLLTYEPKSSNLL
jgi:hypothetical protein